MKKQKKLKARNPFVVSALSRSTRMHHKNMPRGGANNEQSEYLEELDDETEEDLQQQDEVQLVATGSSVGSLPAK